jgi:hypothetical protein
MSLFASRGDDDDDDAPAGERADDPLLVDHHYSDHDFEDDDDDGEGDEDYSAVSGHGPYVRSTGGGDGGQGARDVGDARTAPGEEEAEVQQQQRLGGPPTTATRRLRRGERPLPCIIRDVEGEMLEAAQAKMYIYPDQTFLQTTANRILCVGNTGVYAGLCLRKRNANRLLSLDLLGCWCWCWRWC